jgi:hypothetical protein
MLQTMPEANSAVGTDSGAMILFVMISSAIKQD